jgi:hypothetical protein
MALELFEKESCSFKIGPDQVLVYFRRPNAREMVSYLAKTISSKEPESMAKMLEAGIELARDCILGIKEGDVMLIENGDRYPLATDPARPGYVADWKAVIEEKIPGLLLVLGNHLARLTRSDLEVREKN